MIPEARPVGPGSRQGVLLPRCALCEQVPEGGIRCGVKVKKAFICDACQAELLVIDVGSQQYNRIVNKVRRILN